MTYTVKLTPAAQRDLDRLQGDPYRRVMRRLAALASAPRPPGVEKLAGLDNTYRIRVGDWRVIYSIKNKVLLVLVLKIGHRREVYRKI